MIVGTLISELVVPLVRIDDPHIPIQCVDTFKKKSVNDAFLELAKMANVPRNRLLVPTWEFTKLAYAEFPVLRVSLFQNFYES